MNMHAKEDQTRELAARNLPMGALAGVLGKQLHRTVNDKTGLTGRYDFTLRWSDDSVATQSSFPSVFTAITEQLGLKLQPGKGPVQTLVVDQVAMPTAN